MDIYIMDKDFNILSPIIDFSKSIIWTNRFYKCGDFEMYVPYSLEMKNILTHGNYIYRDKDIKSDIIERPKIIERIEYIDSTQSSYIIVSGRDVSSILDRRVIYPTMVLTGNIETCINSIINTHVINPTNEKRKIATIGTVSSGIIDINIDTQITGDTILKYTEDICNDYKIGFRTDFDKTNKKFIFKLFKGVDRTDINNNPVIFSKEFDNVNKFDYVNDKEKYKNMAVVAGKGEGSARKVIYINDNYEGLDRMELWVDAKDLQSVDSSGTAIPDAEYMKQLEQRGSEKLSENEIDINNNCEINEDIQYHFNTDYFVGDIVKYKGYEDKNERIVESIESMTESGDKTQLTYEEV